MLTTPRPADQDRIGRVFYILVNVMRLEADSTVLRPLMIAKMGVINVSHLAQENCDMGARAGEAQDGTCTW